MIFALIQEKNFRKRMRGSSSLRKEFLKKWLMGLRACSASRKEMSILERKKAIKLSADVAMASARNASTCWTRALINNASTNVGQPLVEKILGNDSEKIIKKASATLKNTAVIRSRKILKKSRRTRRVKKMATKMTLASNIAKRLVRKRTQVLKRLVPGGEAMDEVSLMEETLDYLVSLQAQVDVMRFLANANDHLNRT
ncbi:hypothetical protein NMG60_11005793 [Bertholletia excelsa]